MTNLHPDSMLVLTPAMLRVTFGYEAVARGEDYARRGMVTELEIGSSASAAVLHANVKGSGSKVYETVVTIRHSGSVTSLCNCPVGYNCKHGVAVVFAARKPVKVSAWQQALGQVTADVRPQAEVVPLALQVEQGGFGGPVTLRALTLGSRGKWIKTGASWDDLANSWGSRWENQQHRALNALGRLRLANSTYYYRGAPDAVSITQFGPGVWSALRWVVESGVTIVSKHGTPPVRILADPVELVTGVTSVDGGIQIETSVVVDGQEMPVRDVELLGDPPHGILLENDDELLLGGFAKQLSSAQGTLARQHRRIEVPEGDLALFATGFLPKLRRAVPLTISEDVALPDVTPPVATLEVSFLPGHVTELRWGFRYEVGSRSIDLGVEPTRGEPDVRDRQAEAALARSLPQQPWAVTQEPDPVLIAFSRLHGPESAVFVSHWLPVLEGSESVVVRLVGDRPDYRLSELGPTITVAVGDTTDGADWFSLDVEVSLDGETVEFTELFGALARGDSHLVLASGAWFSLDRPELEQLRLVISEAAELLPHDEGELRLRPEHVGLWDELAELGVIARQSASWRQVVSGLQDISGVPEVAIPAGLAATLRPYQHAGFQWLMFLWHTRLGGILADDMGLGKTVQLLAAVLAAREEEPDGPPVLVVAPTSVGPTWADQARMFAPGLKLEFIERTSAKRGEPLSEVRVRADIVVTSYTLLRLDEDEYAAQAWSAVIFDEAQFVKNRQAATYKAARRLRARVKFAVTGTPMENNLMDLWSMLSIATPGLFASPETFGELYRKPIENDNSGEALARLRRRVRPVMLRRTKSEVATELPPKQEQVLSIPLASGHRKLYDRHLAAVRKQVLGLVGDLGKNRIAILASLTRLRQLSLSPALVDPTQQPVSAKIDALIEMLGDMMAEGHRALVFSQFTGFLALVKARLDAEKIGYVYLDGRTRDRESRIDAFKNGTDPLFLISLKAGGFGLNLTEADYVFILDPWWNPAAENQAVDRAHRIGQESTVMVYRMVSEDTIEEKVVALQERKRNLFDSVMNDAAGLGAPLTADDIRGLLEAD